jgi:small subunit ribosomal protein S24e
MQITITQQQYNPLLKRHEISFLVDHSQTRGTPTRLEVRKALAETLRTNPDVVYVRRLETRAGTMTAKGEAEAYDSIEQGKLVELKYIITRNMPKEKKEASEKAEKPQQPQKGPEKAEQPRGSPEKTEKTEKPTEKKG